MQRLVFRLFFITFAIAACAPQNGIKSAVMSAKGLVPQNSQDMHGPETVPLPPGIQIIPPNPNQPPQQAPPQAPMTPDLMNKQPPKYYPEQPNPNAESPDIFETPKNAIPTSTEIPDFSNYSKVFVKIYPNFSGNNTKADEYPYSGSSSTSGQLSSNDSLKVIGKSGVLGFGNHISFDVAKGIIKIDRREVSFEEVYIAAKDGNTISKFKGNVWSKEHSYRGSFFVFKAKFKAGGAPVVNVVNVLGLEDYVRSVVGGEVGSSWAFESLKAQAIAARTFALFNMSVRRNSGFTKENYFDLYPTIQDQMYLGTNKEAGAIDRAVSETRSMVIFYNKRIINAQFSANSGGQTISASDYYGWPRDAYPYLKSVSDAPGVRNLKMGTTNHKIKASVIIAALRKTGLSFGDGVIRSMRPVQFNESKRVTSVEIGGDRDKVTVPTNKIAVFHSAIGIEASNAYYESCEASGDTVNVKTYGFGHGRGLSQEGARIFAEQGQNFETILHHFYTGVEILRVQGI